MTDGQLLAAMSLVGAVLVAISQRAPDWFKAVSGTILLIGLVGCVAVAAGIHVSIGWS